MFLLDPHECIVSDSPIVVEQQFEDISENDVTFLETNTSPWDDVKSRWISSFEQRQMLLIESDIEVYLSRFPCLSFNIGYELVTIDINY